MGRYIGTTDEPLCEKGIELLKEKKYPKVDAVFASPMKRCIQTAELIYPEMPKIVEQDLRECDFGDFENKNYLELDGNPDYQDWIDSHGTLPFPNGEGKEQFQRRCCQAFEHVVEVALQRRYLTIAFVVHGGTIMGIMEYFALPFKSYYDWQVKNARGFYVRLEEEIWDESRKISYIDKL